MNEKLIVYSSGATTRIIIIKKRDNNFIYSDIDFIINNKYIEKEIKESFLISETKNKKIINIITR